MFSKSYCPFSAASKTLLNHNGVEFMYFDMDIIEDGQNLYNALKFYTRYMTVPNIFIGGIEIGGSDTL
jgi:glutaredoxin 3